MAELEKGTVGRYTREGDKVLLETDAKIVVLLVIGGKKGSGFTISSHDYVSGAHAAALLRDVANAIDGKQPDGIDFSG